MKNNWQIKKLGDVCGFQNGFAFKSKLFKEKGFPVLRISNIQNDGISYNRLVFFDKNNYKEKFDKYQALKGDLVIAMSGATTGKLAICDADEVFYLNQRVGKFEPKKEILNNYLYYFLSTKIEENLKISTGSAQPNLSTEQIKNLEIPLPSLSEQHRIVKILDETFEKIEKAKENTEKNLQNSKELFESYLQGIFANPGNDWENKKLGQILEIDRGGSPRPIQKYLTADANGINWIKIGDTKGLSKYIFKTRQKIKPEGLKKSRLVNEGDFILSNSMSFGRPYIMKTTGAIHDGWLVLKERNKNIIDKDYLYNILSSSYVFNQFDKLAAGSTVRNLNIGLVSSVTIPLPKVPEQKNIVTKLDKLSTETKKLEEIYKQKLADLEELKKSVLKKAFNGEL